MEEMMKILFPENYGTNKQADDEAIAESTKIESKAEKSEMQKERFTCEWCYRTFQSKSGRSLHQKKCKIKGRATENDNPSCKETFKESRNQSDQEQLQPKLWGNHTFYDLEQILTASYNEVTKWKKNLFKIPSGAAGKRFVEEMTRLINELNNKTP